jgi:crossover junction endodeoxyribonuclease RuvC
VRFLGVDPGSRHCGWGVIDRRGSEVVAVAWGRVSPAASRPLPERLAEITAGLAAVVGEHRPERAAVERVYHGASARALIVLAEARGAVLAELARLALPVAELTPSEIKSAVTGSGNADKEQVARMVRLLLGLPAGRLAADAADALAAALAQSQREGFESRVRGAS